MPKKLRFVTGVILVVAAIAYLIITAVRNTAEYYLTVDEAKFAITQPPLSDGRPAVRTVVTSALAPTSFIVLSRGQPKPDMFAAGRDVIVEGRLKRNGTIEARQVLTSCPSKYSAKPNQD
jgi:cytochrome c-type biogenesis protein CcmE